MYRTEPEELPENIVYDYVNTDFQKMRQQLDIEWKTFFKDCKDDIDSVRGKFLSKYVETKRECIHRKTIITSKNKLSYPLDRKSLAKRKKKYRL